MIFGQLAARIDDLRPAHRLFREYALSRIEHGFNTESDPSGKPWTKLNDHYRKYRKRGPSILTEDRHLRSSMKALSTRYRTIVGPDKGKNPPRAYLRIHQEGGPAGRGAQIPKRQYVGAVRDDATNMALMLMQHLRGLPPRENIKKV